MTRRTAAIAAWWIVSVMVAFAMVVAITTLLAGLGAGYELALLFTLLAGTSVAYATVGLLLAWRRPGNRIAAVLAMAGVLLPATFTGFAVGAHRYATHGPADVLGGWFALLGGAAVGPALYTAVPLLAILFPDGRLPGRKWRPAVVLTTGIVAVPSVLTLVKPGPVNEGLPDNPLVTVAPLGGLEELAGPLLVIGILASVVLAIAAVATRFRRSYGVERQQVKWLLAAVVAIGLTLPASFADSNSESGFSLLDALAMASLSLLPLSVGVAVVRYRLYEIDRIVSRTIGWALVTGVLAAAFAATIVGLQSLLAPVTSNDTLAVAASTLVVAALFQPVRARVQRIVDRRFNRAGIDAQRAIDAFGVQLRDEVDLAAVHGHLLAAAEATVQPASAAVWLRGREAAR